ncbi:response regulator transcription factor [Actinomycetaceae bacterium MB13-C1-2]|nr:response regulator transcription factor [Actinomycetaceae bacterium MB13-C1-2]
MSVPPNPQSEQQNVRVVVVEDDPTLNELLVMTMKAEGWEVEQTRHGVDALTLIRNRTPDVVIMDVMIPGIDGVEVVRRLRDRGIDVPVLFLTAKDELQDKLAGLSAGGDDYVTKPFSLEEVVLRLRALVRRRVAPIPQQLGDENLLVVGDLKLNPQTHEVSRGETPIELTATEFALLQYLMENPKIVLSKSKILDHVWNYDFGGKASVVEIYISYLRKKIDSLGDPMIRTVRGVGYSIRPADE